MTEPVTSDSDDLQAVLAEALKVWEVFTADDGERSTRARTPDELAASVMEALREHRDLVPAAIGMEQVGRWTQPNTTPGGQSLWFCGYTTEPVWALPATEEGEP